MQMVLTKYSLFVKYLWCENMICKEHQKSILRELKKSENALLRRARHFWSPNSESQANVTSVNTNLRLELKYFEKSSYSGIPAKSPIFALWKSENALLRRARFGITSKSYVYEHKLRSRTQVFRKICFKKKKQIFGVPVTTSFKIVFVCLFVLYF